MKRLRNTLLICGLMLITQGLFAQSETNIEFQEMYSEIMFEEGYRLIDEGGISGTYQELLGTDLTYIVQGKSYSFIGIIDDCATCPVAIKFGEPGEIPGNIPDSDATVDRYPDYENVTVIIHKTVFENSGDGYFILENKSFIERYMYGMLFVQD